MNNHRKTSVNISYALLLLLVTVTSVVHAADVSVANEDGALIPGFKWTLEENLKSDVVPGVQTENSLSLSFHNSYSPVVASGECMATSCSIPADDTSKKYFVSVLPFVGHTLGGATFSGSDNVTVDVHTHAIPTAQITVRVFQDNHPINGAPDDPEEQIWPPIDVATGLPTTGQFTVHLADAGGRYGATGGEIIQDAFGNPLGTEYVPGSPGDVTTMGTGFLIPDADGFVHIKYIPPAKYGVTVIPPTGQGWIQTSTLEGTKTIDAWVIANEPEFFAEFGPPGPHVNMGFTQEFIGPGLTGAGSVTGTITNNHMARPPEVGFFSSWPFGGCWVGLNETVAAGGMALYAKPCAADSSFDITGIPDGTYDLVVWDVNLDIVIATRTVTIAGTALALGEVPVFDWFGRTEFRVFLDEDEDGFRDPGEEPIPEQATGFRFRNGTPYQGFPTDLGGEAPYDEVFPFFHWLVAEVDFARYKATGVTYVVDNGGEVPADDGWTMPSFDVLNPQPQLDINPNTGNNLSTTLTGPVISLASQLFLGQTNVIEWGKALYGTQDVDNAPYGNFPGPGGEDVDHDGDGEFEYGNGGISGLALYAITRAENDPRYAAAEEWEPGIPRIQLNLYKDFTGDGIIDDMDGDTVITLADVDNYPFDSVDTPFPGAEDVDRNGNLSFDYGDAIQVTYSDSWDDSLPTGCVPGADGAFVAHPGTGIDKVTDCYDGLRNFNQLREGVYDGGYAFTSRIARDINGDPTGDEIPGLLVGYYIVESAVPDGYVLMKEEDKNVDFGDEFVVPAQLPPICVGDDHMVSDYLSFQSDSNGTAYTAIDPADLIEAPYAGTQRPLCDRKQIALTAGKNAAADFFMFTQTPVAAHIVGGVLNDLGNEFDPNNPNFGEKFAPSWVPVSFYDWTGKLVTKVYADEFGKYEALVPSTYTVNAASPTGMSPNMLNACMNDPGLGNDPFYNPQFSTFCYVFQYMPGSTTYLDTPVVPVSAFANAGNFPIDCAIPDNYPLIRSVDGPASRGPVIPDGFTNGGTLSIISEGMFDVPNHLFGAPGEPITIQRNYGFGETIGSVTIGGVDVTPADPADWTNGQIDITVPIGVATGQLVVTTASGNRAPRSVTVTTHLSLDNIHVVSTTIQAAIDEANDGDLILLAPGAYSELVIMDKPVQIQGYGAGVTSISAIRNPATKLSDWRLEIATRAGTGSFDYLPNQEAGFMAEEGPGIIVLGQEGGNFTPDPVTGLPMSRIDGIEISSALSGGAIFVNGYVDNLDISNNKITGNEGTYGGGIRIGNPVLTELVDDGAGGFITVHVSSDNDSINIHDNEVVFNGTTFGPAGGIGLYTGANDYTVDHNFVCGNFAQDHGAGIAHLGKNDNGVISNNTIAFNQNFNQARNVHGGGLFIGGQPGLAPLETEGSGSVVVEGNLIQGNSAGAGLGGGIMLSLINGIDVVNSPGDATQWYGIDIFDNMIVNNHAGWTGAGIAMQDAAKVRILNNTIAHNEATATVGNLFIIDTVAQTATSQPQVGAGIASFAHSANLAANLATNPVPQTFSNPDLQNNIVWENATSSWFADVFADPQFGLVPGAAPDFPDGFSDLGVIGVTGALTSTSSILTGGAMDPGFILDYFNAPREQTVLQTEQTANNLIGIAVALDEGGNFVDVQYGPLSIVGNYHLTTSSDAINAGADLSAIAELADDIDGEARSILVSAYDIGADEVPASALDSDGDGVVDTQDNCTQVANPTQCDGDQDNYGNHCDADFNNDFIVNGLDIGPMLASFGTADPVTDLNCDGIVNGLDIGPLRDMFGQPPGPSGLVN